MKKILKYIISFLVFFSFFINILAFDANLSLDKKQIDINDYINLELEVNSAWVNDVLIKEIKWIEYFDVISQSQSRSSSSSVVIIDWKTETQKQAKVILNITLRAKTKWNYEIWPAILSDWIEEIQTNVVNLDVSWEQLFINNNQINNSINQNNQKLSQTDDEQDYNNNSNQEEVEINDYSDVAKKQFNDNKNLYLLFWILILISLIIFYILSKNKEIFEKMLSQKNFDEENEKYRIYKDKEDKNNYENDIKEKSIIEKNDDINIDDININDKDFIIKLDKIFRNKLKNKYSILDVENKTYEELFEYVNEKEKEEVKNIVDMIYKIKYSYTNFENKNIIEMIKSFN